MGSKGDTAAIRSNIYFSNVRMVCGGRIAIALTTSSNFGKLVGAVLEIFPNLTNVCVTLYIQYLMK